MPGARPEIQSESVSIVKKPGELWELPLGPDTLSRPGIRIGGSTLLIARYDIAILGGGPSQSDLNGRLDLLSDPRLNGRSSFGGNESDALRNRPYTVRMRMDGLDLDGVRSIEAKMLLPGHRLYSGVKTVLRERSGANVHLEVDDHDLWLDFEETVPVHFNKWRIDEEKGLPVIKARELREARFAVDYLVDLQDRPISVEALRVMDQLFRDSEG